MTPRMKDRDMDAIQDKKLLQHLANLEKVSDRATVIHHHHVSCVLAAHTHERC
jgi:hypothetical protein